MVFERRAVRDSTRQKVLEGEEERKLQEMVRCAARSAAQHSTAQHSAAGDGWRHAQQAAEPGLATRAAGRAICRLSLGARVRAGRRAPASQSPSPLPSCSQLGFCPLCSQSTPPGHSTEALCSCRRPNPLPPLPSRPLQLKPRRVMRKSSAVQLTQAELLAEAAKTEIENTRSLQVGGQSGAGGGWGGGWACRGWQAGAGGGAAGEGRLGLWAGLHGARPPAARGLQGILPACSCFAGKGGRCTRGSL